MAKAVAELNERKRLLFLSHVLPYPPDSGVAIRTFHTLRQLASAFDLSILCFYRHAAQETRGAVEESVDALRGFGPVEAFSIPQEHSRFRFVRDHLRSIARQRAYTWYAYDSAAYLGRVEALLRGGIDLVHVESLDLLRYMPLLDPRRTVCVHHNIESELIARRAKAARNRVSCSYLRHQARLLERAEREWAPRLALNVVVSRNDEATLRDAAPAARTLVVPNGVDIDTFAPGGPGDGTVAYIGGTEWHPNLDALEFFGGEILPCIRAAGDAPTVRWVGRSTPAEQSTYRDRYGIELTGYVEDIRDWVRDASCVVVPLRVGGGTRLKITTAWALGRPVVSTSVGCEGLEAVDGENILIRDDPRSFAEAVGRLLRDAELRARLGAGGRRTAERVYSWDVVAAPLIDRYRALLGAGRSWN